MALTPAERARFLEDEVHRYAESKSEAGYWTREEAPARSRREIEALVGDAPDARGHRFFKGIDVRGREVGWVWIGPIPGDEANVRSRWLFQILVREDLRGQGFGRGLLRATEDRIRADGYREFRLNVWAWNRVALALYTSSGYEVAARDDRSLEMRKSLP